MSDAACGPHRRAFTLVFCGACRAAAAGRARGVLRRAVRDCPHGVLASTDCLEKVRTADVAAGCTPPHSRARSTAGPPGASCAWLRSCARFRALCETHGFAENFDALTGTGLRDRAYTWTASSYLLLAEAHARREGR